MKGTLLKSKALKDEWMVRYTTYKTIPGIKGVMGSHSRLPESNYIPIHPDHIPYLGPGNNGVVINFEIVKEEDPGPKGWGGLTISYAKLINEERSTKRSKQKKYTNVMSENSVTRFYTEDDIREAIDMARMLSHVSCLEDGEHKLKYSNTEDDIINSLK
jgi:hypothetical protein